MFAVRHQVVPLRADGLRLVVHGLDKDGAFSAPLFAQANDAGDLGHDGGLAWPASFKDLRDTGQAAGDVLGAADLARRLGQQSAGGNLLILAHFQVGLFRHIVKGQILPLDVFHNDLRVQIALVLHDHPALGAAWIAFLAEGFAFDDFIEANAAADLGQNRDHVRIPFHQDLSRLDLLALLDDKGRPVGNGKGLLDPFLGPEDRELTVAGQSHAFAPFVNDSGDALQLDDTGLLGADFTFLDDAASGAADVEGSHRQLRARLADRLGSDNSHRHAFLDQVAGGQIHTVTRPAHPQRRLASHGTANQDLIHSQLLDFASAFPGDHLILTDDDFTGDGGDVVSADPAANPFAQGTFNFFALVDDALGDSQRRAAVVHGDHDVLGDVGQLAGQITGVGGFESGVRQALAGAVGRAEIFQHGQALAEVGLDRGFDNLAGRLGHEPAHAS